MTGQQVFLSYSHNDLAAATALHDHLARRGLSVFFDKTELRQRGSLTVWFTEAAIAAWKAEPRATRGGQPRYSAFGDHHGADAAGGFPPGATPDRRADRIPSSAA